MLSSSVNNDWPYLLRNSWCRRWWRGCEGTIWIGCSCLIVCWWRYRCVWTFGCHGGYTLHGLMEEGSGCSQKIAIWYKGIVAHFRVFHPSSVPYQIVQLPILLRLFIKWQFIAQGGESYCHRKQINMTHPCKTRVTLSFYISALSISN